MWYWQIIITGGSVQSSKNLPRKITKSFLILILFRCSQHPNLNSYDYDNLNSKLNNTSFSDFFYFLAFDISRINHWMTKSQFSLIFTRRRAPLISHVQFIRRNQYQYQYFTFIIPTKCTYKAFLICLFICNDIYNMRYAPKKIISETYFKI